MNRAMARCPVRAGARRAPFARRTRPRMRGEIPRRLDDARSTWPRRRPLDLASSRKRPTSTSSSTGCRPIPRGALQHRDRRTGRAACTTRRGSSTGLTLIGLRESPNAKNRATIEQSIREMDSMIARERKTAERAARGPEGAGGSGAADSGSCRRRPAAAAPPPAKEASRPLLFPGTGRCGSGDSSPDAFTQGAHRRHAGCLDAAREGCLDAAREGCVRPPAAKDAGDAGPSRHSVVCRGPPASSGWRERLVALAPSRTEPGRRRTRASGDIQGAL